MTRELSEGPGELAVAEALAGRIEDVLGDDLVGIYLTGSAVTGGFDPGVSDLDLIVATRRVPARLDLPALRHMHDEFVRERPAWKNRIEAVYVAEATLRSFRMSTDRLAV